MKRLIAVVALLSSLISIYAIGSDDDELRGGFLTGMLNEAISNRMAENAGSSDDTIHYGRNISKYISVPEFGGFVIGSYKYSSAKGEHGGAGFGLRQVRAYVSGDVLRDFYYRVQVEMAGGIHLKDAYIEWHHFKELHVRFGQYKRPFTFENPMNAWDVGTADYSQVVKKLSGHSDYAYSEYGGSNGGRDIGLMLTGDLLPSRNGKFRFLHYEAGVFNGQGINTTDANRKKDWIGNVQIQPIEGLKIGFFGWKGSITEDGITVRRDRWDLGVQYLHNNWIVRGEYVAGRGHRIADYIAATETSSGRFDGPNHTDGWYAEVGAPCTSWLTAYLKYDAYRPDRTNSTLSSIYSVCADFQLHRNLMLQLQYGFAHDKAATSPHHHELAIETYIRW